MGVGAKDALSNGARVVGSRVRGCVVNAEGTGVNPPGDGASVAVLGDGVSAVEP